MRSNNPALSDQAFESVYTPTDPRAHTQLMTVSGTVNKTLILLALVVAAAGVTWTQIAASPVLMPVVIGASLAGLVVAMITIFKSQWSPITAPVYALLEGVVLGGLSAVFNQQYPGIVPQAVALTLATLFSLLFAYQAGLIRASESFVRGVVAATMAIFVVYLVSMVLGFFGVRVPLIHEAGPIGIAFSLFVVAVAALNLVLDFDFIERGSRHGLPRHMEWYGVFGLVVTLVWLYLEMLRLLAKIRDYTR